MKNYRVLELGIKNNMPPSLRSFKNVIAERNLSDAHKTILYITQIFEETSYVSEI